MGATAIRIEGVLYAPRIKSGPDLWAEVPASAFALSQPNPALRGSDLARSGGGDDPPRGRLSSLPRPGRPRATTSNGSGPRTPRRRAVRGESHRRRTRLVRLGSKEDH